MIPKAKFGCPYFQNKHASGVIDFKTRTDIPKGENSAERVPVTEEGKQYGDRHICH